MNLSQGNPVIAALKKKIPPKHGLPAAVWLAALLVGLVYYRHKHPSTNVLGTSAATVADTSGSGTTAPFYGYGSGDSGGGGGGGDSQGQNAPVSWDANQIAAAIASDLAPYLTPPQDSTPSNDPPQIDPTNTDPVTSSRLTHASQPFDPAHNPASAYQAGGKDGSHLVQPLQWGGQTFYTKADFAEWTRKHGSSIKGELANHPEAAKIYNNLGANDLVAATVPNLGKKKSTTRMGTSARSKQGRTVAAPTPTHVSPTPTPPPPAHSHPNKRKYE